MTHIEVVREALLHSERNLGRLGNGGYSLDADAEAWKVPHDALAALDSLEAELAQANESNAIWSDVAAQVCAEFDKGTVLAWVPEKVRDLRAELAQVREERDAARTEAGANRMLYDASEQVSTRYREALERIARDTTHDPSYDIGRTVDYLRHLARAALTEETEPQGVTVEFAKLKERPDGTLEYDS